MAWDFGVVVMKAKKKLGWNESKKMDALIEGANEQKKIVEMFT